MGKGLLPDPRAVRRVSKSFRLDSAGRLRFARIKVVSKFEVGGACVTDALVPVSYRLVEASIGAASEKT